MVEIATRGMKRFASGMSCGMVSFRAGIPTREIADRRTITENPRPPIHRMADAMCAYRTTSSRMSATRGDTTNRSRTRRRASPPGCRLAARVDDTEEIALGVREDDKILVGLTGPVDRSAEMTQPLDLAVRVFRIQVEMQSAPVRFHPVDGYVGPFSRRVFQNHKWVFRV